MLTKQDLGERCPGAGDLIYNVLRWLIRDGFGGAGGQHLPQSPVTPHFPITPSWCLPIPPPQDYPPHVSSTPTTLHNSVTLSPAPSVDSQSGSPKQPDQSSTSSSSAFSVLSANCKYTLICVRFLSSFFFHLPIYILNMMLQVYEYYTNEEAILALHWIVHRYR